MYTSIDNGYVIADSVFIGNGVAPSSCAITLRLEQWESVVYDKTSYIVDYPGEYELSGYVIHAWSDKTGNMNYFIRYGQKKIFFIQNKKWLSSDYVTDADIWYILDESMKEVIMKRELEGEIVLLEAE